METNDVAKSSAHPKPTPTVEAPIKRFEEAYRAYVQSLDATWQTTCKRVELTYQTAANEWQELLKQSHGSARFSEIFGMLVRGVRESWRESQKRYEEAYRTFLRAFQEAWSKVDVGALEPRHVWPISSAAQLAAYFAHVTFNNWGLLAAMGVDDHVLHLAATPEILQ